jgi:putative ABC transport system permease protein
MGYIRRVFNVFRRRDVDKDIDSELQFHVDMRAADLEREGLDRDAAHRAARRLLGNRASLRDRTRQRDVVPGLESLVTDTRYALRRYFPAHNAIGRTVYMGGRDGTAVVVVGVVADVRHRSLEGEVRPELLIPYVQLDSGFVRAFGRGLAIVLHTELPVAAAAKLLRAQVRQIDANVAVIDLRPMEQLVRDATSALRFRTLVLTVVAAMALVLSAVGIFGVLAYTVSQRSTEIGVRLALGARPAKVFGQVLAQGGTLIVTGAILGVALSAALGRSLEGLLFNISPSDPVAYIAATAVLALVALAAAAVPAWRATQVDPAAVLRG